MLCLIYIDISTALRVTGACRLAAESLEMLFVLFLSMLFTVKCEERLRLSGWNTLVVFSPKWLQLLCCSTKKKKKVALWTPKPEIKLCFITWQSGRVNTRCFRHVAAIYHRKKLRSEVTNADSDSHTFSAAVRLVFISIAAYFSTWQDVLFSTFTAFVVCVSRCFQDKEDGKVFIRRAATRDEQYSHLFL